jgi:hypothetical protein
MCSPRTPGPEDGRESALEIMSFGARGRLRSRGLTDAGKAAHGGGLRLCQAEKQAAALPIRAYCAAP